MEKAWYWKVVLVVFLVVGSVLYLLPTFIPGSLPTWYTNFFDKKINLGLDLKGGLHLVLGVEVEKALEDKADQYVADFKESLREKRIGFKKISRIPGTWDIQFELDDPKDESRLLKRILQGYNLTSTPVEDAQPGLVRVTFEETFIRELRKNARDQCQLTIRNRVDELGVASPDISQHGEVGILVQLPGLYETERAKELLGRTAQLEFKMVDDKSDFIKNLKDQLPEKIELDYDTYTRPDEQTMTSAFLRSSGQGNEGRNRILDFLNNVEEMKKYLADHGVDVATADKILELAKSGLTPVEKQQILALAKPILEKPEQPGQEDALKGFQELLKGKVPDGYEIGFSRKESNLVTEYITYLMHSEVAMTGDYITDARPQYDEFNNPEVSLTFDRAGATKFEKLTGAHVGERMAIVLEGEVSSAPVIQTRIGGGTARITLGARSGQEALQEADDLSKVLRAGALPAPVRILQERSVGPTMGEDARRQGTFALGIGLILVIVFMVLYYRLSGLVADMALVLNALFVLAVMAGIGATLTLPGIAGIILTIGMAVDANVIINERVREELHAGKTPRAAIDAGYSRAFWTIFDANFTTLIAAFVLGSYGSGPIKGFAVTLGIGIFASMFTAIFFTRLVADLLTIKFKVEKLSI